MQSEKVKSFEISYTLRTILVMNKAKLPVLEPAAFFV